jgi:hypothetical protein
MHDVVADPVSPSGKRIATAHLARIAVAVPFVLLCAWLCRAWLRPMTFDDAYMFYRYALNIRDGLGIAWNPDGIPTYGMTSQLWVFFILPLTFLPVSLGHALSLASWLTGIAALATLATAVARHAQLRVLRIRSIAFAVVCVPLLLNPVFAFHLVTGMDTMLSLWANAAVALVVLEYVAAPTRAKSLVLGGVAFVAVLARPDSGLCALGVPLLVWLTVPGQRRWGDLLGLGVLPVVLIGSELIACTWYFHVPLPLGFFAKSVHSYAGFTSQENAVQYAYLATSCALPFAAVLLATLKRGNLTLALVFLLPAALTVLYLLTVRQVMGFAGRYYIPLLPFVVIPALSSADEALSCGRLSWRRVVLACAVALGVFALLRPFELGLEKRYTARVVPAAIAVPTPPTAAHVPLPSYPRWYPTVPAVGDLIASLPAGAAVAASEVGYIAAAAPHATIIDLVGLNDTHFGLEGFSMDGLLARKPDLIWFPDTSYTGLRARMFSDPRLYAQYIVIADMFNFGVAIRRDSPLRKGVERGVRAAWSKLYPTANLAEYVVSDGYIPSRQP